MCRQDAAGPVGIVDVISAERLHIMFWWASLGELGQQPGGREPGPALAATWNTLASLIDLHMRAQDEICVPAICGTGPQGLALARQARDEHEDICEIIGEVQLQPPGSPLWWNLVGEALSAWATQTDLEEHGPLADYRRAAPAQRRLAARLRAFMEA